MFYQHFLSLGAKQIIYCEFFGNYRLKIWLSIFIPSKKDKTKLFKLEQKHNESRQEKLKTVIQELSIELIDKFYSFLPCSNTCSVIFCLERWICYDVDSSIYNIWLYITQSCASRHFVQYQGVLFVKPNFWRAAEEIYIE